MFRAPGFTERDVSILLSIKRKTGNILVDLSLNCIDLRVHVGYGVLQFENTLVDGGDDPLLGKRVFRHEFHNLEIKGLVSPRVLN